MRFKGNKIGILVLAVILTFAMIGCGNGDQGTSNEQMLEGKNCAHFIPDVEEERLTDASFVCLNCTFRRWTTGGFDCLYEEV